MEQENRIHFQSDVSFDLPNYREFRRGATCTYTLHNVTQLVLLAVLVGVYYLVGFSGNPNLENYLAQYALLFSAGILLGKAIQWFTTQNSGLPYKQMLVSNGGKPVANIVTFSEDGMAGLNPHTGSRNSFAYDRILSIKETQNLFLLMMAHRVTIVVDKRTLTGGYPEDFMDFLMERCTSLRRKKGAV